MADLTIRSCHHILAELMRCGLTAVPTFSARIQISQFSNYLRFATTDRFSKAWNCSSCLGAIVEVFKRTGLSNATLGIVLLSAIGCGDGDAPAITPVSGRVTLNGRPVPGSAVIDFTSAEGFSSAYAIESDGTFTLGSEHGAGIPPGTYKVSIKPSLPGPGTKNNPIADTSYIPMKYRRLDTSGFEAVVTEDGNGSFDFDMVQP